MNRRTFLRRAAITSAAAGTAWAAPQIVAVPVARAADIGSRPPHHEPQPPPLPGPVPPADMGPSLPKDLPGTLPFTGPEAGRDAKLGLAVTAAGAALAALAHEPRTET